MHSTLTVWELITGSLILTERINDKNTSEEERKQLIQYRAEIRAEINKRKQGETN